MACFGLATLHKQIYKVKQEAEISYRAAFTQPGVCLISYRSPLPNVRLVSCLVLFYGDEELLHPSSLIRLSLSSPHFTVHPFITHHKFNSDIPRTILFLLRCHEMLLKPRENVRRKPPVICNVVVVSTRRINKGVKPIGSEPQG